MQNIRMKLDGPRLLIEIDLTDNCGMTDKNIVIATTKGSSGRLPPPYNMMKIMLYVTSPLPYKFQK